MTHLRKIYIFDKWFIDRYPETYEQYAIMASNDFRKVIGNMEDIPECQLEGLLKISANGKSVYRKYKAASVDGRHEYIVVGYRSMKYLCASEGDEVLVQKTWWMPFLWHFYDNAIRYSVRIGLLSIIISLLIGIVGLFI